MKITTDHKWKAFKYRNEVPAKVLHRYDWLNEDDEFDGWICLRKKYGRMWFHLSDFMRLDRGSNIPGKWQGYSSDSYFSGTLIELSSDGEMYRIGTYIG
jgi:hypothetical protein